ncbi:hypothetical protein TVAG_377830 [Trichomonas vaginalis G3]|uniref:Uncharacterized protein n=1 Tax=Trichomonas vaginalis (strain ATCC PRA-98 / G3) TaxID=412133 RepID=A2DAX4_TRIV3|nr:hypothetical protein TVAGG3_0517730 [Trichomonas vaginalis G3]EAY22304.1 hypothetical protein TVAG_377830 [Trichomonas vaginalis G3]KAI5518242.1 hypothetical protein TVAGG3_0517730 [Trichomonas vaginalis G3]|eukprot:XP_001583290.1 hypothetical protein [Trichomonas vaginalis G3]
MSRANFPSHVDINLTIHREVEDIKIGFPFDTMNDEIDSIVAELAQTLNLSVSEETSVKASIRQQISAALSRSLTDIRSCFSDQNFDDSSDALNELALQDPEYKALLKRHQTELDDLEKIHLKQQRELMNQQFSDIPNRIDEDLIVFD